MSSQWIRSGNLPNRARRAAAALSVVFLLSTVELLSVCGGTGSSGGGSDLLVAESRLRLTSVTCQAGGPGREVPSPGVGAYGLIGASSETVHVDDSLGEGGGRLLRHVVTDPRQGAVLVLAREPVPVRRTVARSREGIPLGVEGDGGHVDDRPRGEPLLESVVAALPVRKAQPPAVVVDDDGRVVRIVEGCRGALERGVVEVPRRGYGLPD